MVIHRVDNDRGALHVFENRRQISMKIRTNRFAEPWFPFFCRKDEMNEIFREGLRHDLDRPFRAWADGWSVLSGNKPKVAEPVRLNDIKKVSPRSLKKGFSFCLTLLH